MEAKGLYHWTTQSMEISFVAKTLGKGNKYPVPVPYIFRSRF